MTTSILVSTLTKPVTLAQIKQHLRLDHTDDDDYLMELAEAATLHVEAYTGQSLINRTLRQYVDIIPVSRSICLEAWPVREVLSITGYELDGNPMIIAPEYYTLKINIDPPAIVFGKGVILGRLTNGIEIDFVVGYGDTGLDVPANIIRAILVLIAHWYEFRGTVTAGDETGLIPDGLEKLLNSVRRVKL